MYAVLVQFERVLANREEPEIRHATTGDTDPAITGSIAVFDGLPTTDAQPPLVHKRSQNERPPAHAGGRLAWSGPLL